MQADSNNIKYSHVQRVDYLRFSFASVHLADCAYLSPLTAKEADARRFTARAKISPSKAYTHLPDYVSKQSPLCMTLSLQTAVRAIIG